MLGLNLHDLDSLPLLEFEAWADALEKLQKKREKEAREAQRANR